MNQFRLISLILAAGFLGYGECRRLIWKQRTNIGDANNWVDNKIPCASDALLFPETSYDLIKLSNFSMKEIILPKTGGFILDTQTALQFRESDSKCKVNDTKAFKSVIQTPWLLTNNWIAARDTNDNEIVEFYNKATPHEERVPCDNDEIIFPINNSFVVDLQSAPILSFKSIAIDGRQLSTSEFSEFLKSIFGQSSFKNNDNTLFVDSSCNDENKCVCHEKGDALREQLCENERTNCESTPRCTEPIMPIGHCCAVCGALFQMELASINNFNLKTFKADISKGK
jgi:protein amnionless